MQLGYDAPMTDQGAQSAAGRGTGLVLITLGSGQFLMTPDSSVMNVAIATVARDVGTTVTRIQTAITRFFYPRWAFKRLPAGDRYCDAGRSLSHGRTG